MTALLVTACLYWPGLNGPFLFDDRFNFTVIQEWLRGEASLQKAIFGHQSLAWSRPVAMASFVANAAVGGDSSFYFKLGNLLVHLVCGTLVWRLCLRLTALDPRLAQLGRWPALAITAIWLLHPLHVSTVLYAVQRMAQLSSLFCLAAVLVYLRARSGLQQRQPLSATILNLYLSFPLLTLLGVLSKQNAAVAPALCLMLEWAYFQRDRLQWRVLAPFYGIFLILPALALFALLLWKPHAILAGYEDYDFSLAQRLLTEARVLMDYLGQIVVPRAPLMGLYTDDFPISTGLLSPTTTLLSVFGLAGISICAWWMRERSPTVFAGWFFFLLAHVIESSFLPLDIYFEHRNYLPMVGILLALTGIAAPWLRELPTNVLRPQQLAWLGMGALVLALGFATFGRVLVWQSKDTIIAQGLRFHPDSLRAQLAEAGAADDRGDRTTYRRIMERLSASEAPTPRLVGSLYLLAMSCRQDSLPDLRLLHRAATTRLERITFTETHAFNVLALSSEKGCGPISQRMLADTVTQIADGATDQSADRQPQWLTRFAAANLYVRAQAWDEALRQAQLSWQPGADPGMGALLIQLYAREGDLAAARRTAAETGSRLKCHDDANLRNLGKVWEAVSQSVPAGSVDPSPPAFSCRRL
ncbi:hypothetical protein [Pseudoxanthomonas sp. CF385]|uniref:hypothetical protein n=1 Tax=Pseudoxanthomonas sp. CF385 TaxID=1881042 RepID=UPI00158749A6|nr:hypothetical protein [Pseudoxanthomonas sp. CF385]